VGIDSATMPEQATSTQRTAGGRDDELAALREEVLRLRDLLIGKDAELGTLRGRVAELEAGTARLLNIGARLRAKVPSFVWKARAGLRGRRDPQG
jgi:hypothetical protein